jgi:hypothetical protein
MCKAVKISLLLVFLLLSRVPSFAQSPSGTVGSWLMFFNQTRLHEKWSIHSEVQYRSFELTPNTDQIMLRIGANYHINNNYSASLGYAYVPNFAFDKENVKGVQVSENRMWQQFLMKNNLGRVNFEHRYRLEQRWLQTTNGDKYLNRIRYLIRATVPLNKKTVEKHTVFLTFYDELFIHFSNTPFDRNRLYGAIGYQVLPNLNIQLGYLAQTVNTTTRHYLQTAIFYNIDLRKKV